MFAWRYDEQTGGVFIDATTETPAPVIREPRPVYAKELRMRGFDRALDLPPDDAVVAWYEGARLYYRGAIIGKFRPEQLTKEPPQEERRIFQTLADFEPVGNLPSALAPVDLVAMNEKNKSAIDRLLETAARRIVETMEKEGFNDSCVSYSGGKDSEALLEVALRAVACDRLHVIFSDTSMEFEATYALVKQRQEKLTSAGVDFRIARAPYSAEESWALFGAPSRALRWCCSVHKTDPINHLRRRDNVLKRSLSLCGVRRAESPRRMKYEFIDRGTKCVGETTLYPILDWSSVEVWNVLFYTNAPVNELYKLGQKRVGCCLCPMSGSASTAALETIEPQKFKKFRALIDRTEPNNPLFFVNEQWNARRTANHMQEPTDCENATVDNGILYICRGRATDNWNQWFKLLPELKEIAPGRYEVPYKGNIFEFVVDANQDRVLIFVPKRKYCRAFCALLRRLIVRATYCVGCGHCAAQCSRAALSIDKSGTVELSGDCAHCLRCVQDECKRAHSLDKTGKNQSVKDLKQYGLEQWELVKRS